MMSKADVLGHGPQVRGDPQAENGGKALSQIPTFPSPGGDVKMQETPPKQPPEKQYRSSCAHPFAISFPHNAANGAGGDFSLPIVAGETMTLVPAEGKTFAAIPASGTVMVERVQQQVTTISGPTQQRGNLRGEISQVQGALMLNT